MECGCLRKWMHDKRLWKDSRLKLGWIWNRHTGLIRQRGQRLARRALRLDVHGALLRIVDEMQRDKNSAKEVIFKGIEDALQLATQKHYGEEEEVIVTVDRDSGMIKAQKGEAVVAPELLGRIAAQSAKQFMIQKIREAECNAVFDEYAALKGDLVHGTVQRFEGGAATVTLGKSEAILPRGEQIPGETHHVGERVKAVILEVRKVGHRH